MNPTTSKEVRAQLAAFIFGKRDEISAVLKCIDGETGKFFGSIAIIKHYRQDLEKVRYKDLSNDVEIKEMFQQVPASGTPCTKEQLQDVQKICASQESDNEKRKTMLRRFPGLLSLFHFCDPLTGKKYTINMTCDIIKKSGLGILYKPILNPVNHSRAILGLLGLAVIPYLLFQRYAIVEPKALALCDPLPGDMIVRRSFSRNGIPQIAVRRNATEIHCLESPYMTLAKKHKIHIDDFEASLLFDLDAANDNATKILSNRRDMNLLADNLNADLLTEKKGSWSFSFPFFGEIGATTNGTAV